ncbi:MAG: hypothetical protein ACXWLR_11730 [Myxococcales bacterium]
MISASLAAAAAALALAGPAFLAVTDSGRSRPFAPLADFSEACAAAAATFAALAAAAELAALSNLLQEPVSFVLLAPPAIGAAPWAAGELCAGPSPRQEHAFAAALIAAYLVALLMEIPSSSLVLRSLFTAYAATVAYLCARGTAA